MHFYKKFLCLLSIALLLSLASPDFLLIIQAKNPNEILVPLAPDRWTATGALRFIQNPDPSKSTLDWKPQLPGSFLQCRLNTENFNNFNTLTIQIEQVVESNAWFFVYLHDDKHQSAMTYFQLSPKGKPELKFHFLTLFSAFSYPDNFNWNKVQSISLLSHPNADLGIKQSHLQITKVKLSKEIIQQNVFDFSVASLKTDPLLFSKEKWTELRSNTKLYQTESGKTAMQQLNQAINQLQTQKSPKLETLRDAAYAVGLMDLNDSISQELLHKTLIFHQDYWQNLHQENDILVQEEALYFIQIFDSQKDKIVSSQKYKKFFIETLTFIAELEKQSCLYWMQKYPYSQGNNHVSRAACILGSIALLGIQQEEQNQKWLNFSLQILEYYLTFQISSEGVLNEGSHYYVYLMETLAPFSYLLFNALGINLFMDFDFSDRLQKLVLWTHQIENPQGFLPCIDDSWPSRVIFPKIYLYPFLNQVDLPWIWESQQEPWNLLKASYFPWYLLNLDLVLQSSMHSNTDIIFPSRVQYDSDSQVVFRSQGKKHSYHLFLSGKNLFSLHEHDSAGTFQYYVDKEALIDVSGYGPEGWASRQRSYYTSASAHNTLMIDHAGPKGYYNGGIGPIESTNLVSWISKSGLAYAHMDMKWNLRFPELNHQRHFVLMPDQDESPGYLLLIDKLSSNPSRLIQSNLHPNGSFLKHNGQASYFAAQRRENPFLIKIQSLAPWKRELKKGWHSAYWGQEYQKEYLQYSHEKLTFLPLLIQANPPETISDITSTHHTFGSVEELHLKHNDSSKSLSDTFFLNPYQGIQQGKEMGSNAFFSHIRYNHRDMKLEECYVNNGTFLNCQQKGFFYANQRFTFSLQADPSQREYHMQYEASLPNTRVFFYLYKIHEIWWGEEPLPIEHHGDRISFTLPQGKHELRMISKEEERIK